LATGATLEEGRRELAKALEDWLLLSLDRGLEIPPIGDVRIELPRIAV
jgi:hypothetical protein